jgi:hypothetical protein
MALLVVAPLVIVVSLVSTGGAPAVAAVTNPYEVTLVARVCPTYSDITANLARNNIQESLQDLGANTAYQPGQPISPSVETPNQPNCTALAGWKFTFGNGINGQAPGTNLSIVSNPTTVVTTQASTPLLDPQGNATGQSITGAATAALTPDQVNAVLGHNLWIQGGTPTDPLVTSSFGSRYAFGALRCAVDNYNGDNVEWVGFPSGSTHVFCYYYAVDQAPAPGTIVVQKQLAAGETASDAFQFTGTVSYNPGGDFEVPANGSVSFVRDSGVDWNFRERVAPDPLADPAFSFTSVTCTSTDGQSTFPGSTFPSANPFVSVDLAPGDRVVCTYVNTRNLTDLAVLKKTVGGIGGPFSFTVTPPGLAPVALADVTTAATDVPVEAGTLPDATAGTYLVTETLPAPTAAGSWAVTAFDCNGDPGPVSTTQSVVVTTPTVPGDTPLECTFTNSFDPNGSLTITKTTVGAVGTTDFVVTPVGQTAVSTTPEDSTDAVLSATTTTAGSPTTATQVSGSPLDPADLGQYDIVELGPDDSPLGAWSPLSATCNGAQSDPTAADVLVTLTAADPHVTCAFTNGFTPVEQSATSTTVTTTTTSSSTTTAPRIVAGTSTTGPAKLATTGADLRWPLLLGSVLALVGLLLIGLDRLTRRHRAAGPSRDDHRG